MSDFKKEVISPNMSYHDNKVVIHTDQSSTNHGYKIVSGEFRVTDFHITPGQDPEGFNHIGMIKTFGPDGEISFRVGRKGSEHVAVRFKSIVNSRNNTFNDLPAELNFAFLGTLKLVLKGGEFTDNHSIIIDDIVFAQGHDFVSNNWWCGGKKAEYIGDHTINCVGIDETVNSKCSIDLLRGGNDENTVMLRNFWDFYGADWMEDFQDKKLGYLTLPGSHDSGMSETSHCTFPIVVPSYTKTQDFSVETQLIHGVRYFDLRIDYDHDKLVTYHREGPWGCNGEGLVKILASVSLFLFNHPTETVILKFSHIRDYEDHYEEDTKRRISELVSTYFRGSAYVTSLPNPNILERTVGELAGKAVYVYDYDEYIDPSIGNFRYGENSGHFKVYDVYSNASSYEAMKADQLSKWKQYNKPGEGRLFLLSWTLTPISQESRAANEKLKEVLSQEVPSRSRPGIVYMDFVSAAYTKEVVRLNYQ
ncbi:MULTISPECIES: phosphatidylinositol-specific phospholipase C domain-containing protein [Pseudomonas]|uniref:1-phosphatidylinositol phosphodiesterase n=1 Tax=Pseudomonas quercus TaxID=2722792 RepID=A0ABX0Y9G6_9PSED|nr:MULTISPECIES: phosphatidylinositol-specific phospholipase C domain-containing protein [Pseudomonas]MBF7141406.1 hypothetical protein [Pseudomonas sp. LY10J]NJO99944.1 hypothetical protein [Pseudomonas quercus]